MKNRRTLFIRSAEYLFLKEFYQNLDRSKQHVHTDQSSTTVRYISR